MVKCVLDKHSVVVAIKQHKVVLRRIGRLDRIVGWPQLKKHLIASLLDLQQYRCWQCSTELMCCWQQRVRSIYNAEMSNADK